MKSSSSLVRTLRLASFAVLLAGFGLWAGSGAHLGWTQTSVVTLQRDEITGIDFPVRRDAFVAGVEIPLLATVVALTTAGLSVLARRRRTSLQA